MAFPPEAYLIGAQKAGTTTLAYLLDQHPEITLSNPKEPEFFTANRSRDLDWYRNRFHGPPDTIYLDASPSYAAAPVPGHGGATAEDAIHDPRTGVPARIRALRPDAKFIYLLRDPVTRTYSAYWHAVRAGEEHRPFREAVESDPIYLSASDYCAQLQLYLRHFSLSSFHFVLFEELRNDPIHTAHQCFKFLGAQLDNFTTNFNEPINISYTYNVAGLLLTKLFPSTAHLKSFVSRVKLMLPAGVRPIVRGIFTKSIPRMESADRRFLADYFRERNRALQRLAGVSIDGWQG